MPRRIIPTWITCWTVVIVSAIAGCSGGSGPAPIGVQSVPQFTQQSQVAPDGLRTMPPGAMIEYHIPTHHSQPVFIAPAGDGNLWFTEFAPNKIGRITPAGVITEFSAGSSTSPNDIRRGPDGHAWFGTYGPDAIGRVGYDGSVQLFPIPSPTGHPEQLVGDRPRNAIWFTESQNQAIGEFSLATQTFTEFPIPPPAGGFHVHPVAIALDRAGNVWFSDNTNSQVDEMSGDGSILQRLDLPDSQGPASLTPWRMTLASGGDLWLVEVSGGPLSNGSVARIRPSTGSVTTYYPPSSTHRIDNPYDVVAVPGGVWITEPAVAIAHIGPTGHFKEYSNRFTGSTGLTVGSDGNLWIVESGDNAIAKVTLSLFR